MLIDNIITLRWIRHKIVEICDYLYEQKWSLAKEQFEVLNLRCAEINSEHSIFHEIMKQCKMCVHKKNYLRFKDLLMYEMDSRIASILFSVGKKDRILLAEKARNENEEILKICYKDIFQRLYNKDNALRIECAYIGTDNVGISIKKDNYRFRLFSIMNPWVEANDLVGSFEKRLLDEIYVLGFGGGYLLGELQRKFPVAKINVYLPNIDIFRTVICNLAVVDILRNSNLRLCYDPTCMLFLLDVKESLKKNERIGVYLDRQELRACREIDMSVESWNQLYIAKYSVGEIPAGDKIENVGKKIEKYINNFIM